MAELWCCGQDLVGLEPSCAGNADGITDFWVACKGDVSKGDLTVTEGVITAIADDVKPDFVHFGFKRNFAQLVETPNNDADNRTLSFTQTLTVPFHKRDAVKREELWKVVQTDAVVIVKDAAGLYWLMGYDLPVVSSLAADSGTTFTGNVNAYTLTMQANGLEPLLPVNEAAMAGIDTDVSTTS